MDMGTMSMAATTTSGMIMGGGSMTSSAAATMTAKPAMGGMGGGSGCKISMLWNWYTIDACFIARSWRITSPGMFAGSCIGVILLVMTLEFLRRVSREYDSFILARHRSSPSTNPSTSPSSSPSSSSLPNNNVSGGDGSKGKGKGFGKRGMGKYKPSIFEQAIRATLHMVQFTIAYFVMLLAMYYNGYIIICIIIGAWLGAFVFSWEGVGGDEDGGNGKDEATYCCG